MSEIKNDNAADISRGQIKFKPFNFFRRLSVDEIIALESNKRKLYESRGYYISIKQVILAFLMEFVIIAVSLVGNYYLAVQTAALNDAAGALNAITKDATFMLGMLGPIAFAVVETARVPLAISFRTHRSLSIKLLSAFGVICSIGITAKTMVSINQQVYEPRRAEVTKMKSDFNIAVARVGAAQATYNESLAQLDRKKDSIKQADDNINAKQKILTTCGEGTITKQTGDDSVTQSICVQNKASIATVKQSMAADIEQKKILTADVSKAEEESRKSSDALILANKEKIAAQERYQVAIQGSQLHSLAAIFFRKDITQVDDGEVSYLLQFFVYIPAFLVAISSTLVAITAVHSIRPPKESRIIYPEGSEQFLLGPITKTIIEKIKDDLNKTRAEVDTEITNAIKRQNTTSKPNNDSNTSAVIYSDDNINKSPTDAV